MALKHDIKTELGVEVTKKMCHRARRRALSLLTETLKEHYKRLRDYVLETSRTMPASHVVLRTVPETIRFKVLQYDEPLREAGKEGVEGLLV